MGLFTFFAYMIPLYMTRYMKNRQNEISPILKLIVPFQSMQKSETNERLLTHMKPFVLEILKVLFQV